MSTDFAALLAESNAMVGRIAAAQVPLERNLDQINNAARQVRGCVVVVMVVAVSFAIWHFCFFVHVSRCFWCASTEF